MTNNICIVMWFDDSIKEYAEVNYNINKIYCDKYGYSIIKSNIKKTNMQPHWERIPLMIEQLQIFDYVVWVDADALFLKDSPPITNIINEHSDKLFILSADLNKVNECDINTGVIIVKKSPISVEILKQWYTNKNIIRNNSYHILDQGSLRYMYDKNLYGLKVNSIIIPYGILQIFPLHKDNKCDVNSNTIENKSKYGLTDKAFIVHLAGYNYNRRVFFSTSYLKYNTFN